MAPAISELPGNCLMRASGPAPVVFSMAPDTVAWLRMTLTRWPGVWTPGLPVVTFAQQCRDHDQEIQHPGELAVGAALKSRSLRRVTLCLPSGLPTLLKGQMTLPPGESSTPVQGQIHEVGAQSLSRLFLPSPPARAALSSDGAAVGIWQSRGSWWAQLAWKVY